jgi:hypothetical protein
VSSHQSRAKGGTIAAASILVFNSLDDGALARNKHTRESNVIAEKVALTHAEKFEGYRIHDKALLF